MRCWYSSCLILYLILFCVHAFAKDFDFESIQDLITSKNITSIDQLIPVLPDDLKSNYTYVKDSMSLQGASEAYPRALLFSPNGKLVLSFNGDKSQAGYNSLEVMQFRDVSREFELREIVFGENKIYNSEVNPKLCMACHSGIAGLGARPNWSRYNLWPGFFGSDDDKPGAYEAIHLADIAKLPRYSALLHPTDNLSFPYNGTSGQLVKDRPNLRLGLVLVRLEAQRLAKIIESPSYSAFKDAILLTGSNCQTSPADQKIIDDIDSLSKGSTYDVQSNNANINLSKVLRAAGIPASDWSLFYRKGDLFPGSKNDTSYDNPYFYADGVSSLQQFVVTQLADDIAKTDSLFKARYDVSVDTLNIYPTIGQYSTSSSNQFLTKEYVDLLSGLGVSHAEKPYVPAYNERGTDKNCKLFSDRLQKSWSFDHRKLKGRPPNLLVPDPSNRNLMANMLDRKCAACHDGMLAPYFGFDDPKALKRFLRSPGYPHGTLIDEITFRLQTSDKNFYMPKFTTPTQDIDLMRRQLLDYVKSLDSKH